MSMHNLMRSPFKTRLTLLSFCLLASIHHTYAMQMLDEHDMRTVNGQDGLSINTELTEANIDKVYWQDNTTNANKATEAIRATANGINIKNPNGKVNTTVKVNTGTSANGTGLDIDLKSDFGTMTASSLQLCDSNGANCGASLGNVTIQSQANSPIGLHLTTSDGLLNQDKMATIGLNLQRLNVYLTQLENVNDTNSKKNQLILKDLNFNVNGTGYAYIDPTGGLILSTNSPTSGAAAGSVTLARVSDPNYAGKDKPGLNLDILLKADSGNTFTTDNAKGVIRIGASGKLTNALLQFRGVNSNGAGILGQSYAAGGSTADGSTVGGDIMGNTGLAMRIKTGFTNAADGTTFELGAGGLGGYAIQFSNLTPILIRKSDNTLNTDQAYFDTGNVYVNLANTQKMTLPINAVLNAAPLLGVNTSNTLTSSADYVQTISNQTTNPYSTIIAIRGADFQAISRQSKFICSSDVANCTINNNSGNWGLGIPIYNLNANLALYGVTPDTSGEQRLGFGLSMSTQGVSDDGTKSTSILLIDGTKYGQAVDANGLRTLDPNGEPINLYVGLRNVDMLFGGYGTVGLKGGNLNIDMPSFDLAASAQVAAGYLPGSRYRNTSVSGKVYSPLDSFKASNNSDVLFGLRVRLGGKLNMTVIPGTQTLNNNFLGINGTVELANSALQVVEPVDNTVFGLDGLSGKLQANTTIKLANDPTTQNNYFALNNTVTINPDKTQAGVIKASMNLYPSGGAAQRIGDMVMTGGKIVSNFSITPH